VKIGNFELSELKVFVSSTISGCEAYDDDFLTKLN